MMLTTEEMKRGYKLVKQWEKQGFGFKFEWFKETSPEGWTNMGYKLVKGDKLPPKG